MEMKKLVCTRNESPDTCFLCEQEGKDYCMKCADACTETEYQETYKEHTPVKIADIFFGQEITVPYFNHLVQETRMKKLYSYTKNRSRDNEYVISMFITENPLTWIVKKGDKELYKGTNSNRATGLYQSLVDER